MAEFITTPNGSYPVQNFDCVDPSEVGQPFLATFANESEEDCERNQKMASDLKENGYKFTFRGLPFKFHSKPYAVSDTVLATDGGANIHPGIRI